MIIAEKNKLEATEYNNIRQMRSMVRTRRNQVN